MQRSLTFAALLLSGAIATAARQDQAPPAAAPSGEGMPEGPGKAVTVKICGNCHEPRRAASVRLTRDGWSDTIADMVRRGAKGTDDELAQVLDYLATNFLGEAQRPLNVNTASQIDLETVAGLLRKEAAAVLEYRDKNGPFKNLDDMKKVPGLDFKKIDSRRDYLVAIQ
jgi:competence protein ComEA